MLYYNINYYHNRLFLIDNKYYVYIYVVNNLHIYHFKIINNSLILFIENKNIKKKENFTIKIIVDDKEVILHKINHKINHINFGNINEFKFNKSNKEESKNEMILKMNSLFSNFNVIYYLNNNKFLKDINLEEEDHYNFIKIHWYLCGQFQPQMYFKYLLYKYEELIFKIKYPFIKYSEEKKNTLLFIDDRYDESFKYLLILFLYSVDISWNITVFTTIDNRYHYEIIFFELNIEGKIILLEKSFEKIEDYSNLLKSDSFWNKIKEENVLIFQYDSFCMGKFDNIFFNYNYIGARWPHQPLSNKKINIGNGGTSFRKTRIMEMICNKYNGKKEIEDIFFAESLYDENLLNCTDDIADKFSFENIFCENSIYAHQIYNTIKLEDMDKFMYRKISNLL